MRSRAAASGDNLTPVNAFASTASATDRPAPWPAYVGDLLLREPTAADLEPVLAFRNDPAVNRFMVRTQVTADELRREWAAIPHSDTDWSCLVEREGDVVAMGFLDVVDAAGQPGHPAEAPDAHRPDRQARTRDPAGERRLDLDPRPVQLLGQRAGLGRAAEQQHPHGRAASASRASTSRCSSTRSPSRSSRRSRAAGNDACERTPRAVAR